MAHKRTGLKKKRETTESRGKRSSGTIPWRNLLIVLFLIVCGVSYFLIRYDLLKPPEDKPSTPVTPEQNRTLNLYYAHPYSEKLVPEQRTIRVQKTIEQTIKTALRVFMEGPKGDLVNTIPSGTILNGVRIDREGVVSVDFSSHLSKSHPGGSSAEILTVYAIVDTVLMNFDEATKVRILIEGKDIDTLAGHINCRDPFEVDRSFIQ